MSDGARRGGLPGPTGGTLSGAARANRQPKGKTLSRTAGEGGTRAVRRGRVRVFQSAGTLSLTAGEGRAALIHQAVELGGVLAGDLVDHLRRQSGELLVDVFCRFLPDAVRMRVIRAPHDGLDADIVDQLGADRVELEGRPALAPPILARLQF